MNILTELQSRAGRARKAETRRAERAAAEVEQARAAYWALVCAIAREPLPELDAEHARAQADATEAILQTLGLAVADLERDVAAVVEIDSARAELALAEQQRAAVLASSRLQQAVAAVERAQAELERIVEQERSASLQAAAALASARRNVEYVETVEARLAERGYPLPPRAVARPRRRQRVRTVEEHTTRDGALRLLHEVYDLSLDADEPLPSCVEPVSDTVTLGRPQEPRQPLPAEVVEPVTGRRVRPYGPPSVPPDAHSSSPLVRR